MNSINEYFLNKSYRKYDALNEDVSYIASIKEFYEVFIKKHFVKMFVDNKRNFIKWCEVLENYADSSLPIFWIRKFESGSGKDSINDNRRTATTVLVDKTRTAVAAFSYISNFDAQELYNIILNVDPSDLPDEFESLMLKGNYKFHYDCGEKSIESSITSFECLSHANSLGIFNAALLYLAHITDVNGSYSSDILYEFESGDISQWQKISSYSGYDFRNIFDTDQEKKIRVAEYEDNPSLLKAFLKAHFFRFVHPFNYYLVPGKSYEVNAIMGKSNVSIGEFADLTNYVKYRMYLDFIKNDADLHKHFEIFESNILIDKDKKISDNYIDLDNECKILGDKSINIVYGYLIGKNGRILKKLSKQVSNVSELYDLYQDFSDSGDYFAFCDQKNNEVGQYKPNQKPEYTKFLENLEQKIKQKKIDEKTIIRVELKNLVSSSSSSMVSLKKSKATALKASSKASRKKYDRDTCIELCYYYLTHKTGLKAAEKNVLKNSYSGNEATSILIACGIDDTSLHNRYKGLLIDANINNEIANATNEFKKTLEEIKKRKSL